MKEPTQSVLVRLIGISWQQTPLVLVRRRSAEVDAFAVRSTLYSNPAYTKPTALNTLGVLTPCQLVERKGLAFDAPARSQRHLATGGPFRWLISTSGRTLLATAFLEDDGTALHSFFEPSRASSDDIARTAGRKNVLWTRFVGESAHLFLRHSSKA